MDDAQGKGRLLQLSEEDREIFNDFITESLEGIEEIEPLLLELEEDSDSLSEVDPEIINKIFRTFHSMKGSASYIGLQLTSELTHHAETLLDNIRRQKVSLQSGHIDILLKLCDFFRDLLHHLADTFSEAEYSEAGYQLIAQLQEMVSGESHSAQSLAPPPTPTPDQPPQDSDKQDIELFDEAFVAEMAEQFLQDANDLLDELEQSLLQLEKDLENRELMDNVFRLMHSLKGNSGFLGYNDIHEICHKAETFLDRVRNGELKPDAEQFSLLTDILDFIRMAIEDIAQGGKGNIPGVDGVISMIEDFLLSTEADASPGMERKSRDTEKEKAPPSQKSEPAPHPQTTPVEKAETPPPAQPAQPSQKESSSPASKHKMEEVIRVDVSKLNALMDLVGEIVIAESMVSQHPELRGRDLPGFEKAVLHLQKNIRELQEIATSMRMIPIQGLFRKMNRLVRDLSKKSGKKIELKIFGGETEIDRSVIEHISDPLVHIIRNSVDHGIEPLEERRAKGKPETARIALQAKQVGREIQIRISDDGRGLDREKILQKAQEKNLLPSRHSDLSDEEVWRLIFLPGFSTADKVTDISGRGVGMDVVVRNIEKIRGRVEIHSEKDKGTTVTLRIPLTTAIIDGMIIRVGNSLYAIPMLDIRESLVIRPDQIVQMMDGEEVVHIRNSLYPVVRIHEFHNITLEKKPLTEGILIIVESTNNAICVFADELIGQKQLVIKPIPEYLGNIEAVSGCAILGNGEICLILDIASLVKASEKEMAKQEYSYAG